MIEWDLQGDVHDPRLSIPGVSQINIWRFYELSDVG